MRASSESEERQRLGQSFDERRGLGTMLLDGGAPDVENAAPADDDANFEGAFARNGADDADLDAAEGLLSFRNSFESFKLPFILPSPALPLRPCSCPLPPCVGPLLPPPPMLALSSASAAGLLPSSLLRRPPRPPPRLNLNSALGITVLLCRRRKGINDAFRELKGF